ncbi:MULTISPECIES: phosphatase PAP2 family protein [unclassified Agrobacterium]|uniref:phosphatase PAP2 family protein n=1 Tax=unclassified Agrobacterium TaxID=2632611 RepID=UPI00244873F5|nr:MULTISPECIES: phosphatase PAP2 family protein [unclassified Agrobacterium]MDH0614908.1 phosphatase PAP2 family protein [Agrobacterium sp. GD03872]MDH0699548.1 phosphatase PAP2 family protein [Agrobacterium sp. GD03871]MDH1061970.1 phosphatase PAP2 family protein [Agrobacterium sp. GD03992]MDH2211678.1 phosphatase PAP2 family protein [Agrobacterium sp. GD03643]MDH2220370.1 phosphatase PAP2 family protein [Agrobacterium sp. GD03638]
MHQSLTDKTHLQKPDSTRGLRFRASAIGGVHRVFVRASGSLLLLTLSVALAMMAFFTMRPDIDLNVSRQFWMDGFLLSQDEFLLSVRDLNRMLPPVLVSGLVCMLFLMPFWGRLPRLFPPHKLLLVTVFFLLGPGALVHVLKTAFGRARPRHLVEFGGDLFFTPVLSLDGGCVRNCSFPSGESASAIALLAFTILLPEKFRLIGTAILAPFIVIVSLNRVAMGAHFFSDVLIAWPLMFAVFLLLHWPFTQNRHAIDAAFLRKARGMPVAMQPRSLAEQ